MNDIFAPGFVAKPYWWDAAPPEEARDQPLPEKTDVAVVGSGYCGLTAAMELARAGIDATVIEAGPLGFGASTRSGGMVSSGQKLVLTGAIETFGPALADQVFEESKASYALVQTLIEREGLDADFQRCGRFFGAYAPSHYARLERNAELLRKYTQVDTTMVPRTQQRSEIGSDHYYGGFVVSDYGGVHPAKYNRALRQAARRAGAALHSHAAVEQVRKDGDRFRVETARGTIQARDVVIATNGYTDKAVPYLRRRIIPVRSYIIATEPLPKEVMDDILPKRRMMSDSRHELNYFRPSPDGTRLLFGCRPTVFDHDEAIVARRGYTRMLAVYPQLKGRKLTHGWSGYVGMTFDHVPHLGTHDGIHYAMGCNGNGVAMATYLGYQTAMRILGRQNRPSIFDNRPFPSRPYYAGWPWMIPVGTAWYHLLDRATRRPN